MSEAIIGALGVVIAALAIWLTIRIVSRHERWAKWSAAALFVAVVVYPLSGGLADRLRFRGHLSKPVDDWLFVFYGPCGTVIRNAPKPVRDAYNHFDAFCVNFGDPPRPRIALKRGTAPPFPSADSN